MGQLFLSRQPIFSRDGLVWGYEIQSKESEPDCAADGPSLAQSIPHLLKSPENSSLPIQCILHADQATIRDTSVNSLDKDKVILSVDSSLIAADIVTEQLDDLRGHGARLSLLVNNGQDLQNQDLSRYQLIAFPFQLLSAPEPSVWLGKRNSEQTKFLVQKIENHTELEFAKATGADLFQGNFFKRPRGLVIERLPSVLVNRFKLLQLLETATDKPQDLIRAIEADIAITLRLFRFMNSPHFGLTRKIDSVRQCVQLLGWAQLKTWIRMLVVVEMCPEDKTKELAYSSALRGRFLELLALYSNRMELADTLFLLGLFSLLEPMLERPFEKILKDFRLPGDVANALLGQGGTLQPWLEFIDILDDGNWLRIVSRAKLDAIAWTNEFWSQTR